MLIITGAGRSGTSAVAKLVHNAGMSVGRDLIPPDHGNADGYFEERAVVALNERILGACGLHEWFGTATRERVLDAAAPFAAEMTALAANATPAWKDPRFSWTLEAWLPHFPQPPSIVICLRSPAEVVASTATYFAQAGAAVTRAAEHLWVSQYERLLDVISVHALDAVVVEYGLLQDDPERALAALADVSGLSFATAHVRRELRHHDLPVPVHFSPLYERVRALGRRGERLDASALTAPRAPSPKRPSAPSA
jgi:hypothetical protein